MNPLLILFIFFMGCTSFYKSDGDLDKKRMLVSSKCCSKFDRNGECLIELIPGCASNSASKFRESFLVEDKCCELWGADGMCYKELVKDCSEIRNN